MTIKPDEATKAQFRAFTSDPARLAKYTQAAMTHGFFYALEQARSRGEMGPALFAHEYRRYYGMLLAKIEEAARETERMRAALNRLERTAENAANKRIVERMFASPEDDLFQRDLWALQGWLASLVESHITMVGYIMGTSGATRKVDELSSACRRLIQIRQQQGNMASSNPELFRSLTEG